jgi:tight adherence protein C
MNPQDLLPAGVKPEDLVALLAATAAFLSVVAVWYALVERDPVTGRARALAARREQLRAGLVKPRADRRRRQQSLGLMRRVVDALKLLRNTQGRRIQDLLARAGYRSRDAIVVYLFFKLAAPVGLGAAAFAVYVLALYGLPPALRLLAIPGAVAVGFFSPDVFIRNAVTKRQKKLQKSLPDSLDLLVICAEAGLSLDAALDRVANEIARSDPELAEEIGLTAIELGFLPDRRQALHNLNRRTDLPSIRGVVNTLLQTEKYGTPLSQSLRVLAAEFRNERLMRAEEKAARLPAILTVPMIVFILPCLFVVLLGPAMIQVVETLSKM